ncbi:YraN family protein [Brevibacillus migulae]|uniref:YraN family protein n=1 Tax=Brevibacillus migulae TaxID=1644114 RepID=UPI00106DDC0F|nr:YraN family protein [Brevibacillus migulae]
MRDRKELGKWGEDQAAQLLQAKGFEIIARNWRTRGGEIDLIAKEHDVLVFVEVRTRSSTLYGTPSESVDWRKQQKLRQLSLAFLGQYPERVHSFRFDVVSILRHGKNKQAELTHIEYAF